MGNLREKIINEVREKAENMDEGALEEWLESLSFESEVLEMKCEVINRILSERGRKFLRHIAKELKD